MGDTSSKYAGPDYSDFAESIASGAATATGAIMGKSFGKQLLKTGKKAMERISNQSTLKKIKIPKMADKAPKINLRKEYKD